VKQLDVVRSQLIPRFVPCPIIVSVSALIFMTDYLRRYVRVHLFPYDAFKSLHHRDADHHEFGNLCYRNLANISSISLVLTYP